MKENDFPIIVNAILSDDIDEVKRALVTAVNLLHELMERQVVTCKTQRNVNNPSWINDVRFDDSEELF